jgi:hypothetical protein
MIHYIQDLRREIATDLRRHERGRERLKAALEYNTQRLYGRMWQMKQEKKKTKRIDRRDNVEMDLKTYLSTIGMTSLAKGRPVKYNTKNTYYEDLEDAETGESILGMPPEKMDPNEGQEAAHRRRFKTGHDHRAHPEVSEKKQLLMGIQALQAKRGVTEKRAGVDEWWVAAIQEESEEEELDRYKLDGATRDYEVAVAKDAAILLSTPPRNMDRRQSSFPFAASEYERANAIREAAEQENQPATKQVRLPGLNEELSSAGEEEEHSATRRNRHPHLHRRHKHDEADEGGQSDASQTDVLLSSTVTPIPLGAINRASMSYSVSESGRPSTPSWMRDRVSDESTKKKVLSDEQRAQRRNTALESIVVPANLGYDKRIDMKRYKPDFIPTSRARPVYASGSGKARAGQSVESTNPNADKYANDQRTIHPLQSVLSPKELARMFKANEHVKLRELLQKKK